MTTSGRVSIVIPTYNDNPQHLREAIASAFGQSYPDVEVIVVDDGSDPAVSSLSTGDVPILVTKPNGGAGSARNAGIARASGEFIVCLDADDLLDSNYVAEAVEVMRESGVVVAYPYCRTFGAVEGEQPTAPEVSLVDTLRGSGIFPPAMFRRERWTEIGGFFEGDRAVQEDTEFWPRVLRDGGKAKRVPTATLHWRIRPGSRSSVVDPAATRRAIVKMNAGHEGPILESALEALAQAEAKIRVLNAELSVWKRRTAYLRKLRSALQSVAGNRRSERGTL